MCSRSIAARTSSEPNLLRGRAPAQVPVAPRAAGHSGLGQGQGLGQRCSIKAVGVPCSTPGVQCCGAGGEGVFHKAVGYRVVHPVCSGVGEGERRGCSIKPGGARCSTPGVQCCGGEGERGGVPHPQKLVGYRVVHPVWIRPKEEDLCMPPFPRNGENLPGRPPEGGLMVSARACGVVSFAERPEQASICWTPADRRAQYAARPVLSMGYQGHHGLYLPAHKEMMINRSSDDGAPDRPLSNRSCRSAQPPCCPRACHFAPPRASLALRERCHASACNSHERNHPHE